MERSAEVPTMVRRSNFLRIGAYAFAALLSACGGAQPRYRALPPAATRAALPEGWRGTLIYAAGDVQSYVLTFPKGKLLATIASAAFGACSDANGNVYLTQVNAISEYAHGGTTPIATYAVPGSAYSCSVDPASGKLAAVVFCFRHCGNEIVVFGTHGKRERYNYAGVRSLLYCAYDNAGNLFVDGYNGSTFALLELAKNAHRLTAIALKQPIHDAGQIQWDGKDLAIETRLRPIILRVAVSGSSARVLGRTRLKSVGYRATQSWIQNGKIAVPTGLGAKRATEIIFWNYPAGGNPTKIFDRFIGSGHQMIDAVTFSLPPGS